ncbi:LPS export ABC transporter periplasmic protein LptC [Apibacter muscae]|uniref:LPS export ABC transporter periplasmic protein LptC n=1 Tax=Apibacter muscae TaxID=2509004 RepID=UPI0011AC1C58|nr:LPS export ABC transporter periplasmic protein LptC [Apibacter muscae]TWP31417.1 LPS export ABC transporter periplasmic protein LptC [Apibacter muscae]
MFKISRKLSFIILIIYLLFYFNSCTDDESKKLEKKNLEFPSRQILNANLTLHDSVYIKVKLKSPLIEEYEFTKTPFTLFPKGLKVEFIERDKDEPIYLMANYAKIIESEGWYEAKNNVVVINSDKDTLKTNHLFWDKKLRKIYSDDTVKIYRADGVTTNISSNGIEATEDFKNFKLKNNKGTLPYNNEVDKE